MQLARELYTAEILKFGEFTLQSGVRSPVYLDMRVVPSEPALFRRIAEEALEMLRQPEFDCDCIAGVATGGIPWAAAFGLLLGAPMVYVRSDKKEHGTTKYVEGKIRKGTKALVVDDVATTGTSLLSAAERLRESGFIVEKAFVLVDREQGAARIAAEGGVSLRRLTTLREILHELEAEVPEVADRAREATAWLVN
jgi:orotate phosphoribosyltransferase